MSEAALSGEEGTLEDFELDEDTSLVLDDIEALNVDEGSKSKEAEGADAPTESEETSGAADKEPQQTSKEVEGGEKEAKKEVEAKEEPKPSKQDQAVEEPKSGGDGLTPLLKQIEENESKFVESLSKDIFQLDEETAQKLEENPREVVPKLLAKGYVRALYGVSRLMQQTMPTMVQQVMSEVKTASDNEREFFEQFPQLSNPSYRSEIDRVAGIIRQSNPKMPRDQFMKMVGVTAMNLLGVEGAKAPRAEQKVKPVPPQPSGVTGASGQKPDVKVGSSEDNFFAALNQEFDEVDD